MTCIVVRKVAALNGSVFRQLVLHQPGVNLEDIPGLNSSLFRSDACPVHRYTVSFRLASCAVCPSGRFVNLTLSADSAALD